MGNKNNLYIKASDICLSTEYWPPNGCLKINAEIVHPVQMINLDEYTKKVQDDMMEALRVVEHMADSNARKTILGEGRSSIILTVRESSGHEFMERYEKWKKDEENKLLQEQGVREGYKPGDVIEYDGDQYVVLNIKKHASIDLGRHVDLYRLYNVADGEVEGILRDCIDKNAKFIRHVDLSLEEAET